MSENKRSCAQDASSGEGDADGNTDWVLDRESMAEVLMSLEWLVVVVAATGFLAFQTILNAIYEHGEEENDDEKEQYEQDMAWLALQFKNSSTEGDDDNEDDDNINYNQHQPYQLCQHSQQYQQNPEEESKNQALEAEEDKTENEENGSVEKGSGASRVCYPENGALKGEMKNELVCLFRDLDFLEAELVPKETTAYACANHPEEGEVAAWEKEEEEDEETGGLEAASKKSPDSADSFFP